MDMIKVESTQLDQVGFDSETEVMSVIFKGGSLYEYYGLSQKFFDEFLKSDSKGSFFYKNVKCNKEIKYKKIEKEATNELPRIG